MKKQQGGAGSPSSTFPVPCASGDRQARGEGHCTLILE